MVTCLFCYQKYPLQVRSSKSRLLQSLTQATGDPANAAAVVIGLCEAILSDVTRDMNKIVLDELDLIWCFWPVRYEEQAADTLARVSKQWKLQVNSCPSPDLGSILQYWFTKLQNDYRYVFCFCTLAFHDLILFSCLQINHIYWQ